jgi:hypothetical protein
MTFGAVSFDDEFIIADALLSRPGPSGGAVVHTLAQKATIIADHCALTYAGSTEDGRKVCKELKDMADRGQLNIDRLKAYLREVHDRSWKGLQIAALIMEGNRFERNKLELVSIYATLYEGDPRLGKSVLLGTGGAAFERAAGKHRMVQKPVVAFGTFANVQERALASALAVCGALLQLERTRGAWDALSGAAYEIIVRDGRGFTKADNLAFFFWNVNNVAGRNCLAHPHSIYKSNYVDGVLLVRVLRPIAMGSDGVPIYGLSQPYIIPPVLRYVTSRESEELRRLPPDLSRTYWGHFATFVHPKHGPVVTADGGRVQDLAIERVPEGYTLRLNKQFIDDFNSWLND